MKITRNASAPAMTGKVPDNFTGVVHVANYAECVEPSRVTTSSVGETEEMLELLFRRRSARSSPVFGCTVPCSRSRRVRKSRPRMQSSSALHGWRQVPRCPSLGGAGAFVATETSPAIHRTRIPRSTVRDGLTSRRSACMTVALRGI